MCSKMRLRLITRRLFWNQYPSRDLLDSCRCHNTEKPGLHKLLATLGPQSELDRRSSRSPRVSFNRGIVPELLQSYTACPHNTRRASTAGPAWSPPSWALAQPWRVVSGGGGGRRTELLPPCREPPGLSKCYVWANRRAQKYTFDYTHKSSAMDGRL